MSSNLPAEITSTIQSASINRAPSPHHDINPSTTASEKEPVSITHPTSSSSSSNKYIYEGSSEEIDEEEEDIPYNVIKPLPRRSEFPPLPDLRFEQSYLASIAHADTRWKIAYITIRDQVFLPLLQGMVWALALHGWRYWNRSAQLSGSSIGAKVRRWWYRTNNWSIDAPPRETLKDEKLARDVGDFYQNQSSGGD